ncbi:unnamed protein product [Haemonchus placei]|uniref:COesterase domain-containing protein n=1 Tax=Haemonchus placei TaxID=6290 RepID=A0A0N4W7H1_HAEPC|nr:unnamed protein product [Haemonchus placei]
MPERCAQHSTSIHGRSSVLIAYVDCTTTRGRSANVQRAIIQSGAATAPWAIEPRDVALARTVVIYNAMKCGNMSVKNPDYVKILECFLQADADLIR